MVAIDHVLTLNLTCDHLAHISPILTSYIVRAESFLSSKSIASNNIHQHPQAVHQQSGSFVC